MININNSSMKITLNVIYKFGLIFLLLSFSSSSYATMKLYDATSSSYNGNYKPSNVIDNNYDSKFITGRKDTSPWWMAKIPNNNSSDLTVSIHTKNPNRVNGAVISLLDSSNQEIDTRVIESKSKVFEYNYDFNDLPYGAIYFIKISKYGRFLEISEVAVNDNYDEQHYSHLTNPYLINLIKNSNASEGNLSRWKTTGKHWNAIIDGKDSGFHINSDSWHSKEQVIDLVENGFSPRVLDQQPPIVFSEQFSNLEHSGKYSLNITLLDKDLNVIKQWRSGHKNHNSDANVKDQISSKITHYGAGLRFIKWQHSGTRGRLEDQVLFIMPPNILNSPDKLKSWKTNGKFIVKSGIEGSSFKTSSNWATREQFIDLYSLGYSKEELEIKPPIIFSSRYGKNWHPDFFRLEIALFDENFRVFKSWDSGVLQNQTNSTSSDQYEDALANVFEDYDGSKLRYIKWRESGKSLEYSDDYYGVIMKDPYIGIVSIHPGDKNKLQLFLSHDSIPVTNRSTIHQRSSFFSHLFEALELSAVALLGCNPASIALSSGGLCAGAVAIDAAIIATSVIRHSEDYPSYKVHSKNDTNFSSSWCEAPE
ncbi:hypothetical protein [Vibrio genomosp. F10]|uniref:hypothetical protein n=1 Tax=Vibrio genomosp. F10 TaxID=723171 RepID=UPI0002FF92E7|nr:hypothetical protein [Vibrio genomosp. F10]OEF05397.1 hypothetical protein A1QI_08535 [Vibrio genomosp. F10 str. 9ZB36]